MKIIKTHCNTGKVVFEEILNKIYEVFNDNPAFVFIHEKHRVDFGRYFNNKIEFYNNEDMNKDLFINLRVFDNSKELYFWQHGESINYRLREDGVGNDKKIFEEYHYMWGSQKKNDENWTKIYENRGACFHMPLSSCDGIELPLKYKVINYMKNEEDGTLFVEDGRIEGIYDKNNKKIIVGGGI